MLVRIAKIFDFDAAHYLPNVADDHKCRRMHGHTYRVEVICEGVPDERGMVCDYEEIATAWAELHGRLDHRVLNDVEGLENPTTEILAPWILARLHAVPVVAVRVYESSSTYCEARQVWGREGDREMIRLKKKDFMAHYVAAYMAGHRIRDEEIGERPGLLPLSERHCAEGAGYVAEEAWEEWRERWYSEGD